MQALKIREGMDPEAEMGPVVTATHKAKIEDYIEDGVKSGANLRSMDVDSRQRGTNAVSFLRHALRQCHPGDAYLQGRDFRSGAVHCSCA